MDRMCKGYADFIHSFKLNDKFAPKICVSILSIRFLYLLAEMLQICFNLII